jgi:hypothetical protein
VVAGGFFQRASHDGLGDLAGRKLFQSFLLRNRAKLPRVAKLNPGLALANTFGVSDQASLVFALLYLSRKSILPMRPFGPTAQATPR